MDMVTYWYPAKYEQSSIFYVLQLTWDKVCCEQRIWDWCIHGDGATVWDETGCLTQAADADTLSVGQEEEFVYTGWKCWSSRLRQQQLLPDEARQNLDW